MDKAAHVFNKYAKNNDVSIPLHSSAVKVNNHAYFVIFNNEDNQKSFLKKLKNRNVNAYIGYMPLHSSPMGRKFGYKASDLPITQDLASRIVRLPFYTDLQAEKLEYCINVMSKTLNSIYGY